MRFVDFIVSKEGRNYPTGSNFDANYWQSIYFSCSGNDEDDLRLYQAGEFIGKTIKLNDFQFEQLIKPFADLNIIDCINIINFESLCNDPDKNGIDTSTVDSINEVLLDALSILLKQLKPTPNKLSFSANTEEFKPILSNLSLRVYFTNLWKKVRDLGWCIQYKDGHIMFVSNNSEHEFGQVISVKRYAEHIQQLHFERMHKLYNGTVKGEMCIIPYKYVPERMNLHRNKKEIIFMEPGINQALKSQFIFNQVPFFFSEMLRMPFRGVECLNIERIAQGWGLLIELVTVMIRKIRECRKDDFVKMDSICTFKHNELINLFKKCLEFDHIISEAFVKIFSGEPKKIKEIWLTPFIKFEDSYRLIPIAISNGNFRRIVENLQIRFLEKYAKHGIEKGKIFERDVVGYLSKGIARNKKLQDTYCRAFLISGRQYKEYDNEELDIVIRIGKTYLIIESKSFRYATDSQEYINILNGLKGSDIQRKRRAFVGDFAWFKKHHDKEADFEVTLDNVYACYLSSVPHAVGTNVNDAPVVDMSILERYFDNGCLEFLKRDEVNPIKYDFYNNSYEAEENLWGYLNNPVQLKIYRENFISSIKEIGLFSSGRKLFAEENGIYIDDRARDMFAKYLLNGVVQLSED